MGTFNKTVVFDFNDVETEAEVEFHYWPAEPVSRDMEYGGCSEVVEMVSVCVDGLNILPELTSHQEESIILSILEK